MSARILVAGCGAVGWVFACLLREHGHDVAVLDRREQVRALDKDGLRVTGIWGEHQAKRRYIMSDLAFLGLTVLFFMLTLGFIKVCERLREDAP